MLYKKKTESDQKLSHEKYEQGMKTSGENFIFHHKLFSTKSHWYIKVQA